MLLDENPSIELTDVDTTNLVRLLVASVKKAVGNKIVPAPDNRKPHLTKAQKVRMPAFIVKWCNSYIVFIQISHFFFIYLLYIFFGR